jgi:hypothetical protein
MERRHSDASRRYHCYAWVDEGKLSFLTLPRLMQLTQYTRHWKYLASHLS